MNLNLSTNKSVDSSEVRAGSGGRVRIGVLCVFALVACLIFVATISDVLIVLLALVGLGVVGLWVIPTFGLTNVAVCFSVLMLLVSGFAERSIPSLGALSDFAVLTLVLVAVTGRSLPKGPAGVVISAAVYIGFCVVHSVVSAIISTTYALNGLYSMLVPIAAVIAGYCLSDRAGQRFKSSTLLLTVVSVGFVINAFLGYRQAIFGLSGSEEAAAVSANSAYLVRGQARLMGAMPTNQDFGILCALAAPAFLLLAMRSSGLTRVLAYFGFANAIFLSFLTLLRGSLIAAVISSVVVLLIPLASTVGRRVAAVLTIIASVPLFSWLFISFFPSDRVDESVSRVVSLFSLAGDSSFRARDEYTLPIAIRALENRIMGSGIGSAGPVSQKFSGVAPYGALIPDNGYFIIAIQIGVLGAASILICLGWLSLVLLRSVSRHWGVLGICLFTLPIAFVFGGYWGLTGPMGILGVLVGCALREHEKASVDWYEPSRVSPDTQSRLLA
ncbi:O-antigen ligase family protein [Rhodococcus sp. ANT_H53B]|uniref:O-antigen ligase family protein n=1 Tax=Rhodococcus sp. ANT_H53B TaxID=2597357 RepID=UPI0011EECC06|nr:hypothetical protein [Rhodococcus sp. ANT_H53B]KAA0923620.1 hypothetical protein FQ188_18540 [Rhodococcus sp. ANT_H53B]